MISEKIKILFDARPLRAGAHKNSARSGIYFTALNILKQFINNENIKLTLFVPDYGIDDVNKALKIEFPDKKFDIFIYEGERYEERKNCVKYILTMDKCFIMQKFIKMTINTVYFIHNISLYVQMLFNYFKHFGSDVCFSAANSVPEYIRSFKPEKIYTVLYDVIPLVLKGYYERSEGNEWFFKLVKSLNSEDYYFTISDYTKGDFLKYAPQIDSRKMQTVYLGCNIEYNVSKQEDIIKVKEKYGIPQDKKYLFSLCTIEPRKNLIRIVKTYIDFVKKHNIDDLIFVMGGGNYDAFKNEFDKIIKGENTDKIYQIGYVDDEDLPALYSGAEWFTFTSQYEGFGLPVLEAMKCGCPVITSNNSSLPEVIGDAGIMIDYDSDEQHIEAYEKYYYDENLRKENSQKGMERAKMFTWEKTAEKMLEVIMKNNG